MTKTAYLKGDTFMVRDKIQGAGWAWDAQEKAYKKEVGDDATPEQVVLDVRSIGGVRNRPKKLSVTFA